MIRSVVIPTAYIKHIPADFHVDAKKCIEHMDAEFDEVMCTPEVFLDEDPPAYVGPLWKLTKNFNMGKETETWTFTFSMPFSMMRELLKNDPGMISLINAPAGGALPIGTFQEQEDNDP